MGSSLVWGDIQGFTVTEYVWSRDSGIFQRWWAKVVSPYNCPSVCCSETEFMLECNFNSCLSIGYHEFTRSFSTFSYNTDYENLGVVLPVSK